MYIKTCVAFNLILILIISPLNLITMDFDLKIERKHNKIVHSLLQSVLLVQSATGSALAAGDMLVGVLSGSEVKALQGH